MTPRPHLIAVEALAQATVAAPAEEPARAEVAPKAARIGTCSKCGGEGLRLNGSGLCGPCWNAGLTENLRKARERGQDPLKALLESYPLLLTRLEEEGSRNLRTRDAQAIWVLLEHFELTPETAQG